MKFILFCFCIVLLARVQGQVNGVYNPPSVIPPSPDVASLFKVGDIPVDTKNGTANINVPIYTIKDGRIEIPIGLTYNTVGIKVQQISGAIGIGWNLDCGGAIIRQGEDINSGENRVQFTPDTTATKIAADENFTLAFQLANGLAEKTQPEFIYHFGKYSGSFFYDVNHTLFVKSDNPNVKVQLLQLGDMPYHIDYVSGFVITTDEGIRYTFTQPEYTSGASDHISDFLLTQIFDPNSNKTVNFRYKSTPVFIDNLNQVNMENYCTGGLSNTEGPTVISPIGVAVPWPLFPLISQSYNQISHISFQIDSILFSTGYVRFQSESNRSDGNQTLINAINVYNSSNQIVKSAQLFQSYFEDTHSIAGYPFTPTPDTTYKYRLRLDSVGFFDNTSTKIESYSFFYNQTNVLPAYKYNVPISGGGSNYTSCTAVDYFGYYNGKLANQGLIPASAVSTFDRTHYIVENIYEGDRTVDTVFVQAGSLAKVKYPTGGSVAFTYESNKADAGVTGNLGLYMGGLRIKTLSYYDNDNATVPSIQKSYSYAFGTMPGMPVVSSFYVYNKNKNFTKPGFDLNGDFVCIEGAFELSNFRFVASSPLGTMAYLDMSPVYGQVTETTVSGSQTLGKTIYYNSTDQQIVSIGAPIPEYGLIYCVDKGWIKNGLLNKTEYYKTGGDGSYHLEKSEQNTYTDFKVVQPTIGVISERDDIGDDYFPSDVTPPCVATNAPTLTSWYTYFTAFNSCGVRRLTQKQVTDYTDSGNIVTTFNYSYDSVHFYLTQTLTTDSKGSQLKTIQKYPKDKATLDGLSSTAGIAIDSLVARNMVSTVIEKQEYNNGILMGRDRTNFGVFVPGAAVILPQSIQTQTLQNALDTRLEYLSYDGFGNPLSLSKDQDQVISYIWGYNNLYPVAQVSNASPSDIAYSSFEDLGNNSGNWFLSASDRVLGDGVMGSQCFNASGGSVAISPALTTSKTYVVSYWTKGVSPAAITGTVSGYPIKGKTIKGWTYYEYLVTGVSSFTLSAVGLIDELRLYPKTAQMTTFAYLPLVGRISQCDAQNRITYYQYDAFNRLDLILDQDHNIIKKNCYDYNGNPSNCDPNVNVIAHFNTATTSWTVQMTSVATGTVYSSTIPGSFTSGPLLLSVVPAGMYNVQINQVGGSSSHIIQFGTFAVDAATMSLTNIPIGSTINVEIQN